jgi:hypothetical protein
MAPPTNLPLATPVSHLFRQVRRNVINCLLVVTLDVCPDFRQVPGGKRYADEREIVIGVAGEDYALRA